MPKIRLDQLVVERGMASSRTQAQALIMAGKILRGTERLTKSGMMVMEDVELMLESKEHPWVSRGGMKLAHGLSAFAVNPVGMVCVDVGASTGGFTDVLLAFGAQKVYAVDVGHGQLDAKLRADARVVVMEKTNARHLTQEQIPDPIDLIVCDASFISLKTVLPAVLALAVESRVLSPEFSSGKEQEGRPEGRPSHEPAKLRAIGQSAFTGAVGLQPERLEKDWRGAQTKKTLIALIKPQFEAGKKNAPKGVVRDEAVRHAVCADIKRWLEEEMGWQVRGMEESPITGPKGNREFLIYAVK